MKSALHWPDDDPLMTEALDWLEKRRLRVRRVSAIQLKLGSLNFYPVTGTLNFDSQARLELRGLEGLEVLISKTK